jgi:hypothetical protein
MTQDKNNPSWWSMGGDMNDSDDDLGESRQDQELREGIDYYIEEGLFVFTATFLQKRGYCCESGCRHCPYNYKSEATEL